jgi:hypothetical protein
MIGKRVPTFLEEDSLKQRILVTKHETFVCCISVALLQCLQRLFVSLDRCFELLDVLCSSLSKSGLSLAVSLLSLLRGSIYLVLQ